MALGAVFGALNTMYTAVAARTREIATLRALGFGRGPVVISIAGVLLTMAAFWTLQHYLQRRIPLRRVRKHECPFCGFPVGGNASCEGCGRGVVGSCSHCGESRRVGVLFCGSCGKA